MADIRFRLPREPPRLGESFEAQLEVQSDTPFRVHRVALVGTSEWRGFRRRRAEFFRVEATFGLNRPMGDGSSSFVRVVRFDAPEEFVDFEGERLRIFYELVAETDDGELRAPIAFASAQSPRTFAFPPYRARLQGAHSGELDVALASSAVAPGNELVGEVAVGDRAVDGQPQQVDIELVRRERWTERPTAEERVVIAEASIEAAERGKSRRFVFAIPDDAMCSSVGGAFECRWELGFRLSRSGEEMAFDVPLDVKANAALVGHVPRVGEERKDALLRNLATGPFEFLASGLSAHFGMTRVGLVLRRHVELTFAYPSLGLDLAYSTPEHRTECFRVLFGDHLENAVQMNDTSAEFHFDSSDDVAVEETVQIAAALGQRIEAKRLKLPAPRDHRRALREWRALAQTMELPLAPAGPRIHGTYRGRVTTIERLAVRGVRFVVKSLSTTQPSDAVRRHIDRLEMFKGHVRLDREEVEFQCARDIGRGESDIAQADVMQILTLIEDLIREWTRSGPYR